MLQTSFSNKYGEISDTTFNAAVELNYTRCAQKVQTVAATHACNKSEQELSQVRILPDVVPSASGSACRVL